MNILQICVITFIAGALLVSGSPTEEKRLIKTSESESAVWMTEDEIWVLIRNMQHFIDITDHPELDDSNFAKRFTIQTEAIPVELRFQDATRSVLNAIKRDRIEDFVRYFSSYHNRYYKANTGISSQKWLLSQVQRSLEGYPGNYSVQQFEHEWAQRSIIARIEGSDPELQSEVIVMGAHQDSINILGRYLQAPGADDNAAGSVVVLESLRAIADSAFIPRRTLEFHWYAAEEVGLRGSAAIAQAYRKNNVNVVGMLNFDVPGFQAKDIKDVGIYVDNTNPELNQFLGLLVDEYLDYGKRDAKCGYGCSDHASWTNYGYAAAMPAEVKMHPQMHTSGDNFGNVGFTQVTEFTKLGTSALVEFGEPSV